jgi:hypothetical protein
MVISRKLPVGNQTWPENPKLAMEVFLEQHRSKQTGDFLLEFFIQTSISAWLVV